MSSFEMLTEKLFQFSLKGICLENSHLWNFNVLPTVYNLISHLTKNEIKRIQRRNFSFQRNNLLKLYILIYSIIVTICL